MYGQIKITWNVWMVSLKIKVCAEAFFKPWYIFNIIKDSIYLFFPACHHVFPCAVHSLVSKGNTAKDTPKEDIINRALENQDHQLTETGNSN